MAVRPHRRVAALGILTGLAWTGTKLAVPALVARTIDRGVVPGDRGALLDNIAVLGAVGLAGALIAGLRRWYAQLLAFLIERDIRERLVAHLYRLHLGFHDVTPTGLLVSRTGSDLLQIQQPFIGIPMLLSSIVILLGAIVLLALINVPLMLVALSPTVLILVVAVRFTQRLGPRSEDLQRRLADLSGVVQESITGIGAIKGLGAELARRRARRPQGAITSRVIRPSSPKVNAKSSRTGLPGKSPEMSAQARWPPSPSGTTPRTAYETPGTLRRQLRTASMPTWVRPSSSTTTSGANWAK